MQNVPEDIAASLVRSIGAYIRAKPTQELPGPMRRFKSFRSQTLATRHRTDLLARLEDEVLRKRLVEWLDKDKPALSKRDSEIMRLACERPRGWRGVLEEKSRQKSRPTKSPTQRIKELEARLERQRERASEMRDEVRSAKASARVAAQEERKRRAELEKELTELRNRVRAAEKAAGDERARSERVAARYEREQRKNRRATERAEEQRDEIRARLKEARQEITAWSRRVAELEAASKRPRKKRATAPAPPAARERRPLPVPAGLLTDAPETLDLWLATPEVRLLVDGYNVSKSEGGYGSLGLEGQRDRVVDEVARLVRRKGVSGTVVFDGSEVPPGTSRPRRGAVRVEYSAPGVTADDHLVGLLETWPGYPVIVVTSDRELQDRAGALGATIATSPQLLSLIR